MDRSQRVTRTPGAHKPLPTPPPPMPAEERAERQPRPDLVAQPARLPWILAAITLMMLIGAAVYAIAMMRSQTRIAAERRVAAADAVQAWGEVDQERRQRKELE